MVHFAHAGEAAIDGADGLSAIAEEQCAGWLALRTLLAEWHEFNPYRSDIHRISRKMEGHRTYLQRAFEAKAAELQAHHQAGLRISLCPSCRFESVKVKAPIGAIAETSCVVCRYRGSEVAVTCSNEDCRETILFTSDDGPPSECPACEEALSKDVVRDCLDTGEAITKDNYFDYVPINCPHCTGYQSVVAHHDIYVCVECFETDNDFGICGHCSEGQLGGVPEHSSWVGCEFCDGSAERYRGLTGLDRTTVLATDALPKQPERCVEFEPSQDALAGTSDTFGTRPHQPIRLTRGSEDGRCCWPGSLGCGSTRESRARRMTGGARPRMRSCGAARAPDVGPAMAIVISFAGARQRRIADLEWEVVECRNAVREATWRFGADSWQWEVCELRSERRHDGCWPRIETGAFGASQQRHAAGHVIGHVRNGESAPTRITN